MFEILKNIFISWFFHCFWNSIQINWILIDPSSHLKEINYFVISLSCYTRVFLKNTARLDCSIYFCLWAFRFPIVSVFLKMSVSPSMSVFLALLKSISHVLFILKKSFGLESSSFIISCNKIITPTCNSLPKKIVQSPTLNIFKKGIDDQFNSTDRYN